jgi:hypothetical protein
VRRRRFQVWKDEEVVRDKGKLRHWSTACVEEVRGSLRGGQVRVRRPC